MATLTALKFPSVNGAESAAAKLLDLQQQLINVEDLAIFYWETDKFKGDQFEVIATNLPKEQGAQLKTTFAAA